METKTHICSGCKYCGMVCPENAIAVGELHPEISDELCTLCMLCAKVCYNSSIDEYLSKVKSGKN